MLKDETFYEGIIPKGYDLAVSPNSPYIIVDVDRHEGGEDGFNHVPKNILQELNLTFNYPTEHNGRHYWLKYTGNKLLPNKASGIGIDLRIGAREGNNGGYVKWHPRDSMDIREQLYNINDTSSMMNDWIEQLFCYKIKEK